MLQSRALPSYSLHGCDIEILEFSWWREGLPGPLRRRGTSVGLSPVMCSSGTSGDSDMRYPSTEYVCRTTELMHDPNRAASGVVRRLATT